MSELQKPPVFYKNPAIAVVLCFFWMGLGQLYNGQIAKGIIFAFVYTIFLFISLGYSINTPLGIIGLIVSIILWIIGMVDANKEAKRINTELASKQSQQQSA